MRAYHPDYEAALEAVVTSQAPRSESPRGSRAPEAVSDVVESILKALGWWNPESCSTCSAKIVRVPTRNGRTQLIDVEAGISHYALCKPGDRDAWKK